MATFAARKITDIADNVATILAIESLAAIQGIELRAPLSTTPTLSKVVEMVRKLVPHYAIDHYLAPDIMAAKGLVVNGDLARSYPGWTLQSGLDG